MSAHAMRRPRPGREMVVNTGPVPVDEEECETCRAEVDPRDVLCRARDAFVRFSARRSWRRHHPHLAVIRCSQGAPPGVRSTRRFADVQKNQPRNDVIAIQPVAEGRAIMASARPSSGYATNVSSSPSSKIDDPWGNVYRIQCDAIGSGALRSAVVRVSSPGRMERPTPRTTSATRTEKGVEMSGSYGAAAFTTACAFVRSHAASAMRSRPIFCARTLVQPFGPLA